MRLKLYSDLAQSDPMEQPRHRPPEPPRDDHWFRTLAETTMVAIFVYRDRFLYVNPAAEVLTGFSSAELLQMHFWEIAHPEFQPLVRDRGRARLRGEEVPRSYEMKIARKDGKERWVEFSAGTCNLEGQIAALGTATDVTDRKLGEIGLQESEERLLLAQKVAHSVTWQWTPEDDRLSFSPFADELFNLPIQKMVQSGNDFLELVHPEDRERVRREIGRTLRDGAELSTEVRVTTPRGDTRWLAEKGIAIRDSSGWTTRVIGVAHDISDRKVAERALFQEKERADVTLASIADAVIRTDARGAIDYMNPVAQGLTGWSMAEAYGQDAAEVFQLISPDSRRPLEDPVRRCLEDRRQIIASNDRLLRSRDGREVPVHDSAAPIRNREGQLSGAVVVFKDLSQLHEAEREMDRLASQDGLTGLANRRRFEAELRRILSQADNEPYVLHLDLDRFKSINDVCGTTGGDQMLRHIALLLEGKVPALGSLARLGGDEFGILLADSTREAAEGLADGILQTIKDFRFHWEDRVFPAAASIGIAPAVLASGESSSILSRAEAACNLAKSGGGNRRQFYEVGDAAVIQHQHDMHWVSRLQGALEDKSFRLYHQAILPMSRGRHTAPAFELFIRMVDTDGELISPGLFIPAAERFGLIASIDRWVVQTAVEVLLELSRYSSECRPLFAINLSGASLGADGFLDQVARLINRTGVDPEQILFEITETAAIADLSAAMGFISTLRDKGCRFVLDDFGKGQSSLSYLQNLPVEFLKIDGDFVRNMVADPVQSALVRSIQQMSSALGLKTIAESVEDQETLDALEEIGVDFIQGFFFDRPRPLTIEALENSPTFVM